MKLSSVTRLSCMPRVAVLCAKMVTSALEVAF